MIGDCYGQYSVMVYRIHKGLIKICCGGIFEIEGM